MLPAAVIGLVCLGSLVMTTNQLLQHWNGITPWGQLAAAKATLMKHEPPQESLIALRAEAIVRKQPPEMGEEQAYLSQTFAAPLDLRACPEGSWVI